jgi:hypothetical protein
MRSRQTDYSFEYVGQRDDDGGNQNKLDQGDHRRFSPVPWIWETFNVRPMENPMSPVTVGTRMPLMRFRKDGGENPIP